MTDVFHGWIWIKKDISGNKLNEKLTLLFSLGNNITSVLHLNELSNDFIFTFEELSNFVKRLIIVRTKKSTLKNCRNMKNLKITE